jgi:ABC-type antimicrobial peptide transport system permease subunit
MNRMATAEPLPTIDHRLSTAHYPLSTMNFYTLIKHSLAHYWRTNIAVILGVATAVAVLAGALLVGDSVRGSLRDLALSRLGRTDLVITGLGFFREQLSDDLRSNPEFAGSFNDTCPIIALEGVVTRDENNARAGQVQIYGVDDRFWKFHGVNVQGPAENDGFLSQSLAQELAVKTGDTIILRIEKPSAIPAESLHSRKDDLGVTIRLAARQILPVSSMGEFSLRPQQGGIRAVFLPLQKLQKNLERDSHANVVLLAAKDPGAQSEGKAAQFLKENFQLSDLGLKTRVLKDQKAISLETESAIINDVLAEAATSVSGKLNLQAASILTYLANSIRSGNKEIPYSLVSALDRNSLEKIAGPARTKNTAMADPASDPSAPDLPEIILNEWAARDLGVKKSDEISLDYFLWQEEGKLATHTAKFRLGEIVPLLGPAVDRNFAPEYPGITDTDSLADWDPPFPIDLSRVRPEDEEYWKQYRTTPKAFIRLEDGQKLWASRYGKLTSIRLIPAEGSDLETMRQNYEQNLRSALDPAQMGLTIQSVKAESLQASRGATDFGEYFTYFSFFLVVSALLLTTLFFRLGIEQRLREIGLLRAVGYSIKQIRSIFLREGLILAVLGSLVGLLGAVAYGASMMWGLRTWWVGAVGTTSLDLHITPRSLLIGGIAGILTALVCIWWTLRRLTPASPRSLLAGSVDGGQLAAGSHSSRRGFLKILTAIRLAVLFGLLGLALLLAAALNLIGQAGGFFGAGSLLLIAILFFWSAWLRGDKKQTIQGQGWRPVALLGFRNASSRPGRTVLCIALIASAAFIIVSVDAFRRNNKALTLDKKSGNGGYPLLAEALLPIVHDLNGEQGREELNINDEILRDVKITRFRLRPGDDASCLNLYQPRNPRILAPSDDFVSEARFAFQGSLAKTDEEKINPWLLLKQEITDTSTSDNPQSAFRSFDRNPQSIVPVIADANSMTYVLHLKLGDEITINASNGAPIRLRLVAALSDSIFQGELLMSEKNFLKYFPDQEGYRFFLIDTLPEKTSAVTATLEDKLSDYGFDAMGTEEKLAGFHEVENTYLSTFQTLGGLGLLLGTLGLGAVLLRNVLERRRELALMRAVGYRPSHLSLTVIAENALMLGCGLLTGVFCALLAIAPAFLARGGRLSAASLGFLLLAVLITGLAASLVAVRAIIRSPLLPALRTE